MAEQTEDAAARVGMLNNEGDRDDNDDRIDIKLI